MSNTQKKGEAKTSSTPASTKRVVNQTIKAAKDRTYDIKQRESATNNPRFVDMRGKDFSNTKMKDMMRDGICVNYDFSGADLRGADFTWTEEIVVGKGQTKTITKGFILQGCKFLGAKMDENTNFAACDLRWSMFDPKDGEESSLEIANVQLAVIAEDGEILFEANVNEVDGFTR